MNTTIGNITHINISKDIQFRGLHKGEASAILIDITKNEDKIDTKLINCGPIKYDNTSMYNIFERCKSIPDFEKIEKKIILNNFSFSINDILCINKKLIEINIDNECSKLPIGIGPGGEWIDQHKALHIKFESMVLGFDIINNDIKLFGGIKFSNIIHGNSIFKKEIQTSIVRRFYKIFEHKPTYYIFIYKPEKKYC